jgi:hypothetical protein
MQKGFLEWLACVLSITGAFLVAFKYVEPGYVVWLFSNVMWLYISLEMKFWQQVFIWTVYTITTIIGLVNWL